MRSIAAAFLLFLAAQTATMTNADVIRMISAKLGDGVIVTAIQEAPRTTFDVSVDGLIALKQAGVSDTVIHAMQKAAAAPPRTQAPTPPPPVAAPPVQAPPTAAATPVAPAPPRRVTPAEPPETYVYYRVDPATGELTPLEKVETNVPRFSAYLTVSLKGVASPVSFPYDEPQVFVVQQYATEQRIADQQKSGVWEAGLIEQLAIEKDRRYAAKAFVPIDVQVYGEQKMTLDEKKRPITRLNFMITPRAPLRPGQYTITPNGLFQEHFLPPTVAAFGIVAR